MIRFLSRARNSPSFVILCVLAAGLIAVAVFADIIAPHDPIATDYPNARQPGSAEYPLGTDELGRCILSRLIHGGRTSLLIVFGVIAVSAAVGVTLGTLAGFMSGRTDTVISAVLNATLALPTLVFVIAYVGAMGPGLRNTMTAMILIGWCEYARASRSMVASLRAEPFIDQAKLSGAGPLSLFGHYLLPNVAPQLLVLVTQSVGGRLLTLAGLSLLGLASQPPTPEWGFMLSEGRKYIQTSPHMIVYPGMVIVIHVLVFSLLGDRLRDLVQPSTAEGLMKGKR